MLELKNTRKYKYLKKIQVTNSFTLFKDHFPPIQRVLESNQASVSKPKAKELYSNLQKLSLIKTKPKVSKNTAIGYLQKIFKFLKSRLFKNKTKSQLNKRNQSLKNDVNSQIEYHLKLMNLESRKTFWKNLFYKLNFIPRVVGGLFRSKIL